MIVLLDTGPLGLISNPKGLEQAIACTRWMRSLLAREVRVILPEIADNEIRRELNRAHERRGIQRLDKHKALLEYAPITAAAFWALARQQGKPTAPGDALDGDVILAAQAAAFSQNVEPAIIATMNPRHLDRFVEAQHWTAIELP